MSWLHFRENPWPCLRGHLCLIPASTTAEGCRHLGEARAGLGEKLESSPKAPGNHFQTLSQSALGTDVPEQADLRAQCRLHSHQLNVPKRPSRFCENTPLSTILEKVYTINHCFTGESHAPCAAQAMNQLLWGPPAFWIKL